MNGYAVVRNEHYGDAIGIALTLAAAQSIAQEDCDRRLAVIKVPSMTLEWGDLPSRSCPEWHGEAAYSDLLSIGYTITRWEVRT